jgi:sRNA-binding protein
MTMQTSDDTRLSMAAILAEWCKAYPAAFPGPGQAPRPLKIGLHEDLVRAWPTLTPMLTLKRRAAEPAVAS